MKKLLAMTIKSFAVLMIFSGLTYAASTPPYTQTDRPYVEFLNADGTTIQSNSGGFFDFILTANLPASITYKAIVHIPSGYTGSSVCRLKLSVDWLPINASSPDAVFNFPSSTGGLISDGNVFTFTIDTTRWIIPSDCGPCSPPCNPLMLHVAPAFYICNSAQNGFVGTTSPSIQGLDINKKCPSTLISLAYFTGTPLNKAVALTWVTESEVDNAGFNIYRSESEDGQYEKINESLIPAQGSATEGSSYDFTDNDVQNRKAYYYKLEDIDLNGMSTMHGPVSATPRLLYGLGK